MADFASASLWIKICMVIIPLSGLIHLIGFASPYWTNTYLSNNGLWKVCNKFQSRCFDFLGSDNTPGWLRATQFFETAGLIAIAVAALMLFLSLVIQTLRNKKIVTIINAVVCFAAAGCIILGVVIYGSQDGYNDYLSWAFALCIVGGLLVGVAGVLIIVGTMARS